MTDLKIKLNTGAQVPLLGMGTWSADDREKFIESVRYGIEEAGYRHIDGAYYYESEKEIGIALQKVFAKGHIKREDLFITTKVWPSCWNNVEGSIEQSCKDLGVDYVDLALVHWPAAVINGDGKGHPFSPRNEDGTLKQDPNGSFEKFWKNMEEYHKKGRTKAIGVSNVSVRYMEKLLETATVIPAMNQIENHPYLPQQELVDYCHSKGIQITAYSPFGSSPDVPLLKDPFVNELAKKYGVGPANILISFQIRRKICVIPKSFNPSRILANKTHVDLSEEDMSKLLNLKKGHPTRFVNGFHDYNSMLGFDY